MLRSRQDFAIWERVNGSSTAMYFSPTVVTHFGYRHAVQRDLAIAALSSDLSFCIDNGGGDVSVSLRK